MKFLSMGEEERFNCVGLNYKLPFILKFTNIIIRMIVTKYGTIRTL